MTFFEKFCQARILSAGEWYSTAQPSGASLEKMQRMHAVCLFLQDEGTQDSLYDRVYLLSGSSLL